MKKSSGGKRIAKASKRAFAKKAPKKAPKKAAIKKKVAKKAAKVGGMKRAAKRSYAGKILGPPTRGVSDTRKPPPKKVGGVK